jgi:hypothetical protein
MRTLTASIKLKTRSCEEFREFIYDLSVHKILNKDFTLWISWSSVLGIALHFLQGLHITLHSLRKTQPLLTPDTEGGGLFSTQSVFVVRHLLRPSTYCRGKHFFLLPLKL